MRILHLLSSLDPAVGGPAEVVRQFAESMNDGEVKSSALTFDAPGSTWLSRFSFPVAALGSTARGGLGHPTAAEWLRGHAGDFDAVIVHGLWQLQTHLAHRVLQPMGRPYFVYPHGMLDPAIARIYPVRHLKKQIYWWLRESAALRDARAVLFTCEEERRLARKTFRPYRCREAIAPLGIEAPPGSSRDGADHAELATFAPTPSSTRPRTSFDSRSGRGDVTEAPAEQARQIETFFHAFPNLRGKRLLLFLGRLHDKKGPDLLIKAFGQILSSQSTAFSDQAPLHLVMAGPPASEPYQRALEQLAAAHCPPHTVSFPAMLSGDLKWGALRAAEAFVLPSHQENFGIAVAEALACGTPVLISNKVNIWCEIEGDGAGLIADDNEAATTQLLQTFLRFTPEERQNMRNAGLRCFENRFEIRSAAAHLTRVIEESIAT